MYIIMRQREFNLSKYTNEANEQPKDISSLSIITNLHPQFMTLFHVSILNVLQIEWPILAQILWEIHNKLVFIYI